MGNQRLDEDAIRAILSHPGKPTMAAAQGLAETYGVSVNTIWLYKRLGLQKARDVAAQMREDGRLVVRWPPAGRPKFTDEQVAYIRSSRTPSTKLAKEVGCSPSLIRMIRTGKAY